MEERVPRLRCEAMILYEFESADMLLSGHSQAAAVVARRFAQE